jgi:hypothetical protein
MAVFHARIAQIESAVLGVEFRRTVQHVKAWHTDEEF